LVLPLISGGLFSARAEVEESEDDFYRFLSVFTDALRLVRTVYVEPVDLRMLMAGALDGAADALDPFSRYVPAEQVGAFRRADDVGRGHSGLLVLKDRGVAFAVAVDTASPAERAGVQSGDIVSKVQGLSTREMPLWQIEVTLAGPAGSKVPLELVRRGDVVETELVLGTYPLPSPALSEHAGVAVLRLPRITAKTVDEVAALLSTADQSPLLIDVRGAAGGDPRPAYALADLFVDGELGQLLDRSGVVERFSGERSNVWSAPRSLSILADRGSQGAAEVVVAVLRARADALVLGEPTFGHAGRLDRVELSSGGLLQVTDGFYAGPDGARIDSSLEPDTLVPRVSNERAEEPFDGPESDDGTVDQDAHGAGAGGGGDAMLERALELARQHASQTVA
jgi:carboxyl-terminal processing protease